MSEEGQSEFTALLAPQPSRPPPITNYRAALKPLLTLAFPVTSTAVFVYLLPMTSIIFAGQLGEKELAGAGLATMWAGVTAYSVGQGLLTALESLASQAFGSGNYPRVGVLYQRALFVLALFFIPISLSWWFMAPVLRLCQQPHDVVLLAEKYIQRLLYGLLPLWVFEATRRFLQVQGIARPMLYVSVIADVLHPFWNWLFIYRLKLGLEGAAVAIVISQSSMCGMLLLYIALRKPHARGTWTGFTVAAFELRGFTEFMCLAAPGAVMLCLEWWLFEIIGFFCGAINTLSLSSNNIIVCITSIAFTAPYGFAVATCTICGNFLGAGDPESSRRVAVVGMSVTTGIACCYAVLCLLLRFEIPKIWSDDKNVIDHTANLLYLIAIYLILDAFQCISQGVLRGCGKQSVGALVALVGFYVVTLPAAYALAFPLHLHQKGLWIGMNLGYVFVSTLYVLVVLRLDWRAASAKAMQLASGGPFVLGMLVSSARNSSNPDEHVHVSLDDDTAEARDPGPSALNANIRAVGSLSEAEAGQSLLGAEHDSSTVESGGRSVARARDLGTQSPSAQLSYSSLCED